MSAKKPKKSATSRERPSRPGSQRTDGETAVSKAPAGGAMGALTALGVFVWALAQHLLYLRGDRLLEQPVSAFFFADGVHFLEKARHLAAGTALAADLPFHPPMVSWLLVPLWRLLDDPASVYAASKVLMAGLNAATYAFFFLLLRRHAVAVALPVCLLLPIGFGELLMSSVANSEALYRCLLAALLLLGWRWPLLAGALHAAASLTRAEHLLVGLALAALLAWRLPERRRALATTVLAALLLVAPYAVLTGRDLAAYNAEHAAELPKPLPVVVPVSFYGPLNFALAQTEDDIFFSRRTLPVTQGEDAALDPLDPKHNAYIVDGYRIGLEAILDNPGRFVDRTARKAAFSLHALAHGWTWRDLPKGPIWTRPPVDMAYAPEKVYEGLIWILLVVGAWRLRHRPGVLGLGLALLVYRLAINVAFFPYLRGMMIAAPFAVVLLLTAVEPLFGTRSRRNLIAVVLLLGIANAATAWRPRDYLLAGERAADGTILDDRTVRIKWDGFVDTP